jgi:hypothetical protein
MAALKFGSPRPPAPYLHPTFQIRMVMLVGAAAVVLAVLQGLLTDAPFRKEWQENKGSGGGGIANRDLDTGWRPRGENEPWVTLSEEPVGRGLEVSPTHSDRSSDHSDRSSDLSPGEAELLEKAPLPAQSSAGNFPASQPPEKASVPSLAKKSLPTRLVLPGIEDNRQLVPSEWPEWLRVFAHLQEVTLSELEGLDPEYVTFVQLFDQPQVYRGRLLGTVGFARRAHRVQPPRNDYGIRHYYQLWLQVDDHPSDPVALWCLELPPEFPLGMSIEERVEVVGYFFKLMSYLAGDGKIRRAPLILAKTVRWQRRPSVVPETRWDLLPLIVLAALALSVGVVTWVYFRTRSHSRPLGDGLVSPEGGLSSISSFPPPPGQNP